MNTASKNFKAPTEKKNFAVGNFTFIKLFFFRYFIICNMYLSVNIATWGINPFSGINYAAQPLTESDAQAHGFKKISDCGGILFLN